MSEFSIDTVDNSLSGFQFVDEQTSEVYGMTFTNSGSRFQDKIVVLMTTLRGRQIILHYLIWVELQHNKKTYTVEVLKMQELPMTIT